LGTAINGAVDSPIQGGVKLYRQTFLDPTYEATHPEQKADIETLRTQILEYASVIDQALDLHAQVCKDTAFHEALRSRECIASSNVLCADGQISSDPSPTRLRLCQNQQTGSLAHFLLFTLTPTNHYSHQPPVHLICRPDRQFE
jgi:hypothetical protein